MNKLDNSIERLIRDPAKRRAWVKFQVQLQGRSMAQVAADAGVNRSCLYSAFFKPYPRMERAIAESVGLTAQQLFPERYDADGLPARRMGRPRKSVTNTPKNTTPRAARNVKRAPGNRQDAA